MCPQRRSGPDRDPWQQQNGPAAHHDGDGPQPAGDAEPADPAPPYRSLFDQNPEPVFAIDSERRFTGLNPAAERMSGYGSAELLGQPLDLIVAPRDRAHVARAFGHALRGEAASAEASLRRKDGRRIALQLTFVPAPAQQAATGAFAIARDVTAERRGEAEQAVLLARAATAERRAGFLADAGALLSSSLQYEETLAGLARLIVPDLADWCAIDLAIPATQAASGTGVRRLAAARDPALDAELQGLREQFEAALRDPAIAERLLWVIRRGRSVFIPEVNAGHVVALAIDDAHLRLLQRIGITSFMRVPLSARGQTLGAISFASAGSGRRFTRADLTLAEELGRRAGLAVDNARLYQEAQQAVRMRDEFLATASHDLRTPVTSIKAFAQMLARRADRVERVPAPEIADAVQAIEAAASRITAHLDELLDLSRLHAGQPLELNRRPTDLVALCREIVAAHQPLAGERRLLLDAQPERLLGIWDGVRLGRVIDNLIANAIKYSYSADESEVLVRLRRGTFAGQPAAVLQVVDHGIGIPEADLPRVFDRFFRAGNVGERLPGTGIGLAGAREIVHQHGGEITIASREGEGTTVTVTLPIGRVAGERLP
ncbi:MAG TPA: PAS domain-containing sensor histidine kinase [Dehalococcoidia bacterium]|nr:PAS domain-containing sensor histidine kinase [Dehalococcoidia bacterium]